MKKPELLAPAGDAEKLKVVYDYGADAAYMGIYPFSLRRKAEDIESGDAIVKPKGKKLYGAVNIVFPEKELDELGNAVSFIGSLPLDGLIVSDIGAASVLRKKLPSLPLHLSTQASCMNSEAVKVYKDFGFSRIILARECSLDDIKRIKDAVPEMQIEVFVHGAMCMAVSGRCILSAALANRSANLGECSHSCRWKYRLALEEEKRPGEYMPVDEENGYTTILSSRDLCMIDHLDDVMKAGADSIKIEGRMKSVYYAATVTRAYRKALDKDRDAVKYRDELVNVSHREYTTGFYYGEEKFRFRPPFEDYTRNYRFLGIVGKKVKKNIYEVDVRYQIKSGEEIEYIGPDVFLIKEPSVTVLDENFEQTEHIDHCRTGYISTRFPLREGYIIRTLVK